MLFSIRETGVKMVVSDVLVCHPVVLAGVDCELHGREATTSVGNANFRSFKREKLIIAACCQKRLQTGGACEANGRVAYTARRAWRDRR